MSKSKKKTTKKFNIEIEVPVQAIPEGMTLNGEYRTLEAGEFGLTVNGYDDFDLEYCQDTKTSFRPMLVLIPWND